MSKPTFFDFLGGIGGWTTAGVAAGLKPVAVLNHWRWALDVHELNYPGVSHICEDACLYDYRQVPDVDFLVGSIACQPHSSASQPGRAAARGGALQYKHQQLRSTAWAVSSFVEAKRPAAFIIENVVGFLRWPALAAWMESLRVWGYSISVYKLRASDMGVPQRRVRVFVIGVLAAKPLDLQFTRDPEPAFGPCIDWSAGGWQPVAEMTKAGRARVAKARRMGRGETFLTQHTSDHSGTPLTEPIRTITGADQWGLVHGDQYRLLSVDENLSAMSLDGYRWPVGSVRKHQIDGIGNAVCGEQGRRILAQVRHAMGV